MTLIQPTATPAWHALTVHYDKIKTLHLREMFAKDPGRGERFAAEEAGLYLDYSKNRIIDETLRLLLRLAEERRVAAWRRDVSRGKDQCHGTACRVSCGAEGAEGIGHADRRP